MTLLEGSQYYNITCPFDIEMKANVHSCFVSKTLNNSLYLEFRRFEFDPGGQDT